MNSSVNNPFKKVYSPPAITPLWKPYPGLFA